jgi:endogenous inhibitor of DNA gyrase (YacG/DUF329 family)
MTTFKHSTPNVDVHCGICGKDLEHGTRGKLRKYCSIKCTSKAKNAHRDSLRKAARESVRAQCCRDCGKLFTPTSTITKFCTKACRDRFHQRARTAKKSATRVPVTITCLECGKHTLRPYGRKKKYCSLVCKNKASFTMRVQKAASEKRKLAVCVECGINFERNKFAVKAQKFCSTSCRARASNRKKRTAKPFLTHCCVCNAELPRTNVLRTTCSDKCRAKKSYSRRKNEPLPKS